MHIDPLPIVEIIATTTKSLVEGVVVQVLLPLTLALHNAAPDELEISLLVLGFVVVTLKGVTRSTGRSLRGLLNL